MKYIIYENKFLKSNYDNFDLTSELVRFIYLGTVACVGLVILISVLVFYHITRQYFSFILRATEKEFIDYFLKCSSRSTIHKIATVTLYWHYKTSKWLDAIAVQARSELLKTCSSHRYPLRTMRRRNQRERKSKQANYPAVHTGNLTSNIMQDRHTLTNILPILLIIQRRCS